MPGKFRPYSAVITATFVLSVVVAWPAPGARAGDAKLIVGTTVADFQLPTSSGETWSLADASEASLLVIAFMGTECPLAQLYAPRLEALARQYESRGVRLVAVDANAQDSLEEIKAFAEQFNLTFPVLKDEGARVADALGATRTPEVFLLDASRTVRYHGRVDDQGRVGFVRLEVGRNDLAVAMDELLAGKPVSQPELPAIGCLIGRRRESTTSAPVTYAKEVSRIFQRRCIECHRAGEIGPFSMENFDDVAGWADMIREVVEQERMPPWFANPAYGKFLNDARLTPEEKQTIFAWIDAGAPLGDASDLPAPRQFVEGWNIGEPDQVVKTSETPFEVPAEGVLDYEHFVVDPGWTEDKWIVAAEVRPGARSVVHHVFVMCIPPNEKFQMFKIAFDGGLIGGYAPGMPPFLANPGVARKVKAGSKIVFQLHYTPNGRPQQDITSVGFKFCDASQVQQEVEVRGASYWMFMIPPGAANHELHASYKFRKDEYVANLLPHMHLRGKAFRYVAKYPDGTSEILLDVPKYDFNWQIQYEFDKPKLMPKGTTLECTGVYDNSADNPANPDPTEWVRPGEQTWHEMMIGWYSTLTVPKD
ncbi:MAG: redoxin domain-containing protein [Pirellulales bacterium]|nr:redoxin domain-containing protein [Pirellulales bacterium]